MSIKKLVAVLVFVLSLGIQTANAVPVTYDFVAMGNAGESGYGALVLSNPPLTLTITSTSTIDDDPNQFAYLDNNDGDPSKPGGLGVCSDVGPGFQCFPMADDNMVPGETLHFAFSQQVTITELVFSNHNLGHISSALDITADANAYYLTLAPRSFSTKLSVNPVSYSGELFTMTPENDMVYLASMTVLPVPEPGSLSLMGLGIIGLSFLRRHK